MPPFSARLGRGAVLIALLGLTGVGSAAALDVSGAAILLWTSSEGLTFDSEIVEQRFSLGLAQELSPFLHLRLDYSHYDFESSLTGTADFGRRIRTPRLELFYSRPVVSAAVGFERRSSDGDFEIDTFDSEALTASVHWRPRRDFFLSAQFRDDSNVADVSALGRDIDQRQLGLDARYQRKHWSLHYSWDQNELDNRSTGFAATQDRHELRLTANEDFSDNRFTVAFSGSVSRIERQDEVPAGLGLAEPVPAVQGLFAIDPGPEVGELEPLPGLIDGDFASPVAPEVDIGGGNTFRNLGVDLGLPRPVTRLEVTVDRPSDPGLAWSVLRSADNLIWEGVPGAQSVFDAGLLRYTVRFPETTERYLKLVNTSANGVPRVLVTELRALREVDELVAPGDLETTLYRADLTLGFRPNQRVSARISVGGANDEDLVAGLVRRDFHERHASARLAVQVAQHLEAGGGFRYSDAETLSGAELFRTSEVFEAHLRWTPLPTVDALLAASRRDDSDQGTLLQSTDAIGLTLLTELLPDLSLTSRLAYSRLTDPLGGADRTTWSWREEMRSRPTPQWTLDGEVGYSLTESLASQRLLERRFVNVRTTWAATGYLNLRGDWGWSRDNDAISVRQRYGVSYAPGPKLGVDLFYEHYRADPDRQTGTASFSARYRMNPRLQLLGSWIRSETQTAGLLTTRVDSLQAGLSLYF